MALDRQRLQIIDTDECLRLVRGTQVGRLGYLADGVPQIVPVNHVIDGWTLLFRSVVGGKLVAAAAEQPLTFQVDDWDSDSGTGWSVMVKGVAETVHDAQLDDRIAEEAREQLRSWAVDDDENVTWVRLHINDATGRRIVPESKAES